MSTPFPPLEADGQLTQPETPAAPPPAPPAIPGQADDDAAGTAGDGHEAVGEGQAAQPVQAAEPETPPAATPPAILVQAVAAAAGNVDDEHEAGSRKQEESKAQEPGASGQSQIPTASVSARQRTAEDVALGSGLQPYGDDCNKLDLDQDGFATHANVAKDGRVDISIKQSSRRLSNALAPALLRQLSHQNVHALPDEPATPPPSYIPPSLGGEPGAEPPPPMNVVIHVVGSRGDVQPFIALGKELKERYNHRVRLATHATFKNFVEDNGLEFFSIGGDPAELMAFMVKNPGLMPGFESLRAGDVGVRRKGMYEIIRGCWRSCIEAGDGTGVAPSDDYVEDYASFDSGISIDGHATARPFVADAIIANPPSFAHVHCAEKLGIPLHLMFTMPWSPTQAFPHPLANVQSSNADSSLTNFVSYALVEMMTWQGLGDMINRFREKCLALEPVSLIWAPGMASRLRIPYTYCWSPALIPKPKDWGPHISISGFFFLSLASGYTPDPALVDFLASGPPPVYIGFGSIVVDDPDGMTKLIFEAIKKAGVRALVSKGWGGFGADEIGIPEGVHMLGNVPHDWLFQHVSCVVHHGGAGTTAAGIALGKPTVVVPFFGDQPFWGAMIARAGAGPPPVPYKHINSDKLAAAILDALRPAALDMAAELGQKIAQEKGTETAAMRFHDNLNVDDLRCSLSPGQVACWRVKRTNFRLSALAATILGNAGLLEFSDLKLYRPREYDAEDGPWDPISGGASALLGTLGSLMMGVADFPVEILKTIAIKPEAGKAVTTPTASKATTPSISRHSSMPLAEMGAEARDEPIRQSIDSSGVRSQSSGNTGSTGDPLARSGSSNEDGTLTEQTSHTSSAHDSLAEPPDRPDSLAIDASVASEREGTVTQSPTVQSPTLESLNLDTSHSRPSAMSQILGELGRSNSGSRRSGSRSHSHTRSDSPTGTVTLDTVVGATKGVGRIVSAGLKSPMDFTLALARGFHNAPKLYGDETVRPADKVTGIHSGLKAAGKEFGYGFFDGISGLVMQPIKGAKDEGAAGFVKGIGKGLGGVVLKPGAAIWGLPGYTFKGIYKELQKHFGSSVQNYIIAARTAQGFEAWQQATEDERQDIIAKWKAAHVVLEREKQKYSLKEEIHQKHIECKATSFLEERKHHAKEKREDKKRAKETAKQRAADAKAAPRLQHAATFPSATGPAVDAARFEEAIKRSVALTSRGDAEQDILIERAIRASVSELVAARGAHVGEAAAMDRAIDASVAEASRGPRGRHDAPDNAALQSSLQQSLQDRPVEREGGGKNASDDSAIGTDDDEDVKRALEESKRDAAVAVHASSRADDVALQAAIEESKRSHEQREDELTRTKTEEEIVMEYIRKQSLAEEELRRAREEKGGGEKTVATEESAEELKRAMEESLKVGDQP
ncbi:MAG: hypothetical protein M1832_003802 [Thelocarpon impressellum]|nr:MAG: hypothetical protein M1832_003802 [Thelocarpon impressellum]